MSAPAAQVNARQRCERAVNGGHYELEVGSNTVWISCREFLTSNPRCGGGCADLP